MRPVDADKVIDRYYEEWEKQGICSGMQDRDWLKRCIDNAPTIDIETVVHCSDCLCLMFSDCYGECKRGYLSGMVRPSDYCSRGERKEDNT